MAKQRPVDTRFWEDNYIVELDPTEKLLFLYILTNPMTTLCGVYELPLRRMAFDTGIDKDMLKNIIKRFTDSGKLVYDHSWVCIVNHPKHLHRLTKDHIKGIQSELSKAPKDFILKLPSDYVVPLQSLGVPSEVFTYTSSSTLTSSSTEPLTPKGVETGVQKIVNHYFKLKGWDNKEKDFYKKNKIIYGRYTKPARQLLELCDNVVEYATERVDRVKAWADSNELDWSLETVIKKFLEIDKLQEKEKKPFFKGKWPMYKTPEGKWKVIKDSQHLWFTGKEEEIIYA